MKKMNWKEFEARYDFENTVFELTQTSLDFLGKSEAYRDREFGAFAFNCVNGGGAISLSFDVDTRVDLRKKGYYPPDWTNETMECDVAEIGELWESAYTPIEQEFERITDTDDYEFIDEFEAGFLDSLRKVLVRLEKEKSFGKIRTKPNFWTLVTQVDADTDEEERLLDEVRRK